MRILHLGRDFKLNLDTGEKISESIDIPGGIYVNGELEPVNFPAQFPEEQRDFAHAIFQEIPDIPILAFVFLSADEISCYDGTSFIVDLKTFQEIVDKYVIILSYDDEIVRDLAHVEFPKEASREEIDEIIRSIPPPFNSDHILHINVRQLFAQRIFKSLLGYTSSEYETIYDFFELVDNKPQSIYDLYHQIKKYVWLFMRLTRSRLTEITYKRSTSWIANLITYELNRQGLDKPTIEDLNPDKVFWYQGGTTFEPIPGLYWNVTVLDYKSMYPSIISRKNISWDTIDCEHNDCETNTIGEDHWICTKRRGFVAELMQSMLDLRVLVFPDELKLLINMMYGSFAFSDFEYFSPLISELTTEAGRELLEGTNEELQSTGAKVLYGDTDSVFTVTSEDQIQAIITWAKNKGFDLKIDYEFKFLSLSEKKKVYFGLTTQQELIVKGFMGIKSNTPKLFQRVFTEITELFSDVEEDNIQNIIDQAEKLIQQERDKIKALEFELEEVMIEQRVSKEPTEYKSWSTAIQVYVQALNAGLIDIHERNMRFLKVIDSVKVPIPEYLQENLKGKTKSSKYIPIELVKKEDVDLTHLISSYNTVMNQLIDPIKAASHF
ncbi:MAG: hypothetical protein INQ03_09305 [Candidatus Heimdallarchaeota archaeon]|nr:hypothetical protein [Candidatus Heimdallarchaeota archaeon]